MIHCTLSNHNKFCSFLHRFHKYSTKIGSDMSKAQGSALLKLKIVFVLKLVVLVGSCKDWTQVWTLKVTIFIISKVCVPCVGYKKNVWLISQNYVIWIVYVSYFYFWDIYLNKNKSKHFLKWLCISSGYLSCDL